jgi:hypothetical protein
MQAPIMDENNMNGATCIKCSIYPTIEDSLDAFHPNDQDDDIDSSKPMCNYEWVEEVTKYFPGKFFKIQLFYNEKMFLKF